MTLGVEHDQAVVELNALYGGLRDKLGARSFGEFITLPCPVCGHGTAVVHVHRQPWRLECRPDVASGCGLSVVGTDDVIARLAGWLAHAEQDVDAVAVAG